MKTSANPYICQYLCISNLISNNIETAGVQACYFFPSHRYYICFLLTTWPKQLQVSLWVHYDLVAVEYNAGSSGHMLVDYDQTEQIIWFLLHH